MILNRPKVLVVHGKSGCCFWRTWQPMRWAQKQGLLDVRFLDSRNMSANDLSEGLRWCNIASIRGLLGTEGLDTLRRYQKLGRCVVTDYDDLHFNVSPFNPAYKNFGMDEVKAKDPTTGEMVDLWKDGVDGFDTKRNQVRFHAFKAILQEADLVTTTTIYLKQALAEISGREDNIAVLPNAIDFKQWAPLSLKGDKGEISQIRDKFQDEFRFGWAVSNSHGEDWLMVKPILNEFLQKYPKAKFVCVGDASMDITRALPKGQVEWYPFSDLWEYHYPMRMAMLGLDVAIAPLADIEFNRCKSPLKFAEYTAFGWPVIAQKMEPYSSHIIHGETGLLAGDKDEWIRCLETLMTNKDLRAKLHFNALMACKDMFDLEKVSKEWANAFSELATGEKIC